MQILSMRVGKEILLEGPSTSEPILLEDDVAILVVQMHFPFSDSTARIETSIDVNERIENGSAFWTIWDNGDVSEDKIAVAFAPNAVRVVNVGAGTVRVSLRGNLR